MKIKIIAWAGWASVLVLTGVMIQVGPLHLPVFFGGAGLTILGWRTDALRGTLDEVTAGQYLPPVPPCIGGDAQGNVAAWVKAGERTALICVNPDGRIAEWLTDRQDARLADPSVEFAPQIRFPHSFALDNGVCRVSYSYASIDDNGIRLGEWEEFPPSIRDRDGLTVCYADQAQGRYVAPKAVRR